MIIDVARIDNAHQMGGVRYAPVYTFFGSLVVVAPPRMGRQPPQAAATR